MDDIWVCGRKCVFLTPCGPFAVSEPTALETKRHPHTDTLTHTHTQATNTQDDARSPLAT